MAHQNRQPDVQRLQSPDLPDRPGPAYLLVALRDIPTFHHYDPERVEFWVNDHGRGVPICRIVKQIPRGTTIWETIEM